MANSKFDSDKAIEAIAYVISQLPDKNKSIYFVVKMFYYADKNHLERYGRQITGDEFAAMRDGPVGSGIYDIIKYVRGDGLYLFPERAKDIFAVENNKNLHLVAEPNLDLLSESDIECLNDAIRAYGDKSFSWIKNDTHDNAWDAADENGSMDLLEIARLLPNADEVVEHLSNPYPD